MEKNQKALSKKTAEHEPNTTMSKKQMLYAIFKIFPIQKWECKEKLYTIKITSQAFWDIWKTNKEIVKQFFSVNKFRDNFFLNYWNNEYLTNEKRKSLLLINSQIRNMFANDSKAKQEVITILENIGAIRRSISLE